MSRLNCPIKNITKYNEKDCREREREVLFSRATVVWFDERLPYERRVSGWTYNFDVIDEWRILKVTKLP